jgi:hypothetical protein
MGFEPTIPFFERTKQFMLVLRGKCDRSGVNIFVQYTETCVVLEQRNHIYFTFAGLIEAWKVLNDERVFLSQRTILADRNNLQRLLSIMGSTLRYLNARYTLVRISISCYVKAIIPLNGRAGFCKLCRKLLTQLTQRRLKGKQIVFVTFKLSLLWIFLQWQKGYLSTDWYGIVIKRKVEHMPLLFSRFQIF